MSAVGPWLARHRDLPRLDCELLLGHGLALQRATLIAHPEQPISDAELALLDTWANRLRNGEPLSYITGTRDFWSLSLGVDPAVLVPRPETELLVEAALELIDPSHRVLDLGTGSGAVALAIAAERRCELLATDISASALAVARANARHLGLTVRFAQSNWFDNVSGLFTVIVSNPPYVAADDPHLDALAHEPQQALIAGADGLDHLRIICRQAPSYLRPHGWLLVEHGYDQAGSVRDLFATAGFDNIATRQDLGGLDRVTLGQRPG